MLKIFTVEAEQAWPHSTRKHLFAEILYGSIDINWGDYIKDQEVGTRAQSTQKI